MRWVNLFLLKSSLASLHVLQASLEPILASLHASLKPILVSQHGESCTSHPPPHVSVGQQNLCSSERRAWVFGTPSSHGRHRVARNICFFVSVSRICELGESSIGVRNIMCSRSPPPHACASGSMRMRSRHTEPPRVACA
jgi:hypothetical protein